MALWVNKATTTISSTMRCVLQIWGSNPFGFKGETSNLCTERVLDKVRVMIIWQLLKSSDKAQIRWPFKVQGFN